MINLDEHKSFTDLLEKAEAKGEKLFILLECGKEYFGKPKRINDYYFSIREIYGKEYYDAMFRFDKIVAIEVKAREH